jgi:hypothetical protein
MIVPRYASRPSRNFLQCLQIAVPGPTRGWIDISEYGPTFGPLQARASCPRTTLDRLDSRLGDPAKVNRFCSI